MYSFFGFPAPDIQDTEYVRFSNQMAGIRFTEAGPGGSVRKDIYKVKSL